jgi:hypothetical protein
MSWYLVAGHNRPTDAAPARPDAHLPRGRVRRYPSDTSDAEWEILAPWVPAGGRYPAVVADQWCTPAAR